MAILCPASTSFAAYENALERGGIPFLTVAGRGFYGRPEIRDLLNALAALADPTDDLALAGLLRGSFIPPQTQRDLRDLTRQRTNPVQDRATVVNRLQKVLEWANLKVSAVASDITGVSARAMLAAILTGQEDPQVLAELAKGRLRNKRELLAQALQGVVREHHRFLMAQHPRPLSYEERGGPHLPAPPLTTSGSQAVCNRRLRGLLRGYHFGHSHRRPEAAYRLVDWYHVDQHLATAARLYRCARGAIPICIASPFGVQSVHQNAQATCQPVNLFICPRACPFLPRRAQRSVRHVVVLLCLEGIKRHPTADDCPGRRAVEGQAVRHGHST